MSIHIVLCDDDFRDLKALEERIHKVFALHPDYDPIIHSYVSSKQLLFDLEDIAKADLYILDIDMPEINGVDIADRIREVRTNAIVYFYTSHAEYAFEGYRVEARRFLLKDGDEKLFEEAILYACQKQLDLYEDSITVTWFRDIIRIPIADIIYVKKEQRHTMIYTQSQGQVQCQSNIKDLHKKIDRPYFLFIDRGVFINLDFVRRTDENTVTLFGNTILYISRNRIREVKENIARYFHIR